MADLSSVKLFSGLSAKELDKIRSRMQDVEQPAGKEVVLSGTTGAGFLVILEGEADASLPDGRTRTLHPGDYYGEMALLDDEQRSATITAKTQLKLLAIPRWDFKGFLEEHPEVAWRLLQTLSQRLREAETATRPS